MVIVMDCETIKKNLNTEQACRDFLASIRWKNGFCCPKCQGNEAWITNEIKYMCKQCGHKISVTSGSIFQDSHIPLTKWLCAISILLNNQKISIADFQKELEIGSNRTAIRMKKMIINNIVIQKQSEPPRLLEGYIEVCRKLFTYRNERIFAYMAIEAGNVKKPHIAIQRETNNQTLEDFLIANIKQKDDKSTVISSPMWNISDYSNMFNIEIKDGRKKFKLLEKYIHNFQEHLKTHEQQLSFDEICKRFISENNNQIDYSGSYIKTLEKMLK